MLLLSILILDPLLQKFESFLLEIVVLVLTSIYSPLTSSALVVVRTSTVERSSLASSSVRNQNWTNLALPLGGVVWAWFPRALRGVCPPSVAPRKGSCKFTWWRGQGLWITSPTSLTRHLSSGECRR